MSSLFFFLQGSAQLIAAQRGTATALLSLAVAVPPARSVG